MTKITIGQLGNIAVEINDSDKLVIDQDGVTKQIDFNTIKTAASNIAGSINLTNTIHASLTGVITKGGNRFIHDFNYGNNGTVTTVGENLFIGRNSGNFTMGSTATTTSQASYNVGIGVNTLASNTTGSNNFALGVNSLLYNTTGNGNTSVGASSTLNNITGSNNAALGSSALILNTTGNSNTAVGAAALRRLTTGSNNVVIGMTAGDVAVNASDVQTNSNCVLIGRNTKPLTNGTVNEIIIGDSAEGNGSNTVTLGNTSVATTVLQGNILPHTTQVRNLGSSSKEWQDVYLKNSPVVSSDEKMKENIQSLDLGLDFIDKLRPVSYKFKNQTFEEKYLESVENLKTGELDSIEKTKTIELNYKRNHNGLIAQEVKQVLDDLGIDSPIYCYDEESDMHMLRYEELIPCLIKAVQELKTLFINLKGENS